MVDVVGLKFGAVRIDPAEGLYTEINLWVIRSVTSISIFPKLTLPVDVMKAILLQTEY